MDKAKKRELKSFKLEKKEDFIVYLQEIIVRIFKCMDKQKIYLNKIEKYILKEKAKNLNKSPNRIIIDELVYSEFLNLTSSIDCYLLNLIGDNQKISISYNKFRELIEKKKRKGTLDFQIREYDEDIEKIVKEFNKIRNWQNHVPESILTSEIELIRCGKALPHPQNPIVINLYSSCTLELLEDLYISECRFREGASLIFQHIKKDYSSLIGESVRIERNYESKPKGLERLEVGKLSAEVQGLGME